MVKILERREKLTLEEVKAAISFDQPKLHATQSNSDIIVRGDFLLFESGAVANPAGPISTFEIEIVLPENYPKREPRVFEVAGRVPRCFDRHINSDGDCCITVWEHWLTTANDHSFSAFLNGPVHEYFLSQYWFEEKGSWPFGERPHGDEGLYEAYSDALGIANKKKSVIYHLRLLSQDWPKGHWQCPCGSGKILRHCHRDDLWALHQKIPPRIAKRMLRRLVPKDKKSR